MIILFFPGLKKNFGFTDIRASFWVILGVFGAINLVGKGQYLAVKKFLKVGVLLLACLVKQGRFNGSIITYMVTGGSARFMPIFKAKAADSHSCATATWGKDIIG